MKSSLLLLSLFITVDVIAQDYTRSIEKADSIVQAFVESTSLPGMSISVFYEDGMVWSKGYGYADIENQTPINPSLTKFRIGSVSKSLTAAGMGILMQEGKLDANDIIQTYVPHFPEKEYPITVKQVAGHLAGIRHYRGNEYMSNKLYRTVNEGLEMFKDDPLLFEPGSDYHYSSYGWNLLSAVIEGASGEEFLPFMKENVFGPNGMNNTVPEWSNQDIPNLTHFYVLGTYGNMEATPVDNSYKWAGGGFVGTTEDLIRFGEAMLDYDFINESVQEELMFPQETNNGRSTNYGMGWRFFENNGRFWVGHSGGSVGGSTMFMINKQDRFIIAYAINRSSVGFDSLHFKVAEAFLE